MDILTECAVVCMIVTGEHSDMQTSTKEHNETDADCGCGLYLVELTKDIQGCA